ncbi:hypothetical protein [Mycobacterium sp. ITM-2016-00318]|uniref:hypothetical protein n=1 Tax=Mycobacterium sp. ITM-2016-00318 TaxID=2099693 RepID=UPI001E406D8C|nr:hypothetical protein [Mycobacterium sp. ITM-2016-00318]WNG93307.1 hypothetical protein C6A82_002125 [Mycobacterium sp. ITM-2016-00318]
MTTQLPHPLTTPRAAALAGVLFGLLFGSALILIRTALPAGAEEGAQWLDAGSQKMRVAAILMPFAGIAFLWFIGVVRDGFGRLEDKFFSSVFIGAALMFLAMMFTAAAIGAGLAASSRDVVDAAAHAEVATFGQMVLIALTKTYALRMGAVFMISLATVWLKTGLMPRWLVLVTYVLALGILLATDFSMWMTLAFPVWVLIVSLLLLVRAGVIDLDRDGDR